MKHFRYLIIVLTFTGLFFIFPGLSSQETPIPIEQTYNEVQSMYGENQVFINGIHFDNIYLNDKGIPFFQSEDYQSGYLVLHNKKYTDLLLKYNIYNQKLVVKYPTLKGDPLVFMPPTDFISEFSLNGLVFRQYTFPESPAKFFQVVFDGELKCLYEWHKDRDESTHNNTYMAYEFREAKHKSYLVIDNKLHNYISKASFMKLFPEENKKNISSFMKENKINLRNSPDQKIAELIAYCVSILKISPTAKLAEKE